MNLYHFEYEAYDLHGNLESGKINAGSEQETVSLLKNKNLTPIKIKQIKTSSQYLKKGLLLSNQELIDFTEGLTTLIEAQVPIDKALTLLQGLSDSEKVQHLIESMRRRVKDGSSLSQAMEENQAIFSTMYTSIIRAGEEGGILSELLPTLKQFLMDAEETKRQIIGAMIYPSVLFFVGILSVILMIAFVVPQFEGLFSDSGVNTPASAAFLFTLSHWLKHYFWVLLLLPILIVYYWQWWGRESERKKTRDAFLLSLPIMGKLLLYRDATNFCRTLGALLSAGISLIRCLSITRGVLENTKLSSQLIAVEDSVKSGHSLGLALNQHTDFPSIMPKLVSVGEETGRTAQIFNQLAKTFNHSVKSRLEKILALIEPLLILVLGVLVGGIVIVMLLAVFSMNDFSV